MRKDSETTRYPGVRRVARTPFRVRAKVQGLEIDRLVEAEDARAASAVREQLRQEALARLVAQPTGAALARACFADFAATWLRQKKATKKIAASTADRYEDALVHILTPYAEDGRALGVLAVEEITRTEVEAWLAARASGRWRATTVNSWLALLKQILADACDDLDLRNPSARVKGLPTNTLEAQERAPVHYSAEELRTFLDAYRARYPQWFPLVLLCATTGLRFGEATALRWSDLDRERRTVRVERSHVRKQLKLPKTTTGIRTAALLPDVLDVLDAHRVRLVRAQHPGLEGNLVFPNARGGLFVNSSAVNRATRLVLRDLKLEKRRLFHGLRHTANALFARSASGAVVRAQMGHAAARMTEHYDTAWAPEQQAMVRSAFADVLPAGGDAEVGTPSETTKAG
ncbi:MAG: site-specific integrase [Sandaracinus sp.]